MQPPIKCFLRALSSYNVFSQEEKYGYIARCLKGVAPESEPTLLLVPRCLNGVL